MTNPVRFLRDLYVISAVLFGALLWAAIATGQPFGWSALLFIWLLISMIASLGAHLHLVRE